MSEYVNYSDGPGSIGALRPLAALSHAPTIGSNDPARGIGKRRRGSRAVPRLAPKIALQRAGMGAYSNGVFANGDGVFDGCGCMGTDANGNGTAAANGNGNGMMGLPSWAPSAAVAAVIGGWWYMKKKKEESLYGL